jgi:hypothetical protein
MTDVVYVRKVINEYLDQLRRVPGVSDVVYDEAAGEVRYTVTPMPVLKKIELSDLHLATAQEWINQLGVKRGDA